MSDIDEDTLNKEYFRSFILPLVVSLSSIIITIPLSQSNSFLSINHSFSYLFIIWLSSIIFLISMVLNFFYFRKEMDKKIKKMKAQFYLKEKEYSDKIARQAKEIDVLTDKCKRDPMTKLYNKIELRAIVNTQVELAKEKNQPFSLIFIDIDDFKKINTEDYTLGDSIIEQMGLLLSKRSRGDDYVIRYGGDEFIIVSDLGTNIKGGYDFAESIRKKVEEHRFLGIDNLHPIKITVSCGVTVHSQSKEYTQEICKQLVSEASNASTEAKKKREDGNEKNYVCVHRLSNLVFI